MRFTSPLFALLLIPVALGLFWTWRHVFGMARARKRFAFIVRAILASLIVVALMGPESHRANHGIATMFVIDRSDSVSDEDRKIAETFVN